MTNDPSPPRRWGIAPETRQYIIIALTAISLTSIVAEVVLLAFGVTTSEALLTICATATGAVAGLAVPQAEGQ